MFDLSHLTPAFEGNEGGAVRGTFSGTTVDFEATLDVGCGGDFMIEIDYWVTPEDGSPAYMLPAAAETLSNIEADADGQYVYTGTVPVHENESVTLKALRYRPIPGCDRATTTLGSVDWRLPLRFDNDSAEHATGVFTMHAESVDAALDHRNLHFAAAGADRALIVRDVATQAIAQVLTAYHLAVIEPVDGNGDTLDAGFSLTLYARDDIVATVDPTTRRFSPPPGAVFLEKYRFTDPDLGAPAGSRHTLQIQRYTAGSTEPTGQHTYTHDTATGEWGLWFGGDYETLYVNETVAGDQRGQPPLEAASGAFSLRGRCVPHSARCVGQPRARAPGRSAPLGRGRRYRHAGCREPAGAAVGVHRWRCLRPAQVEPRARWFLGAYHLRCPRAGD